MHYAQLTNRQGLISSVFHAMEKNMFEGMSDHCLVHWTEIIYNFMFISEPK